jgi:hypothetical protein
VVKGEEQEQVRKNDAEENKGEVEELQTEDIDTSNWKEYCNQEYGFCVKYPENWRVEKIKFATILPVPLPINCKKTPEKCPFEGVQFFSEDNSVYADSTYFSVIVSKNDELKTKNGWYVNKIKGNDFAPGDMCRFAYIRKISNQQKILVSTSQNYKSECNKEQKDELFNEIIKSIKVIK